jgi:hypothetical protein
MSAPALHPMSEADIRARYRELDAREEELKRQIFLAQDHLAGVRELKRQIAAQIFDPAQEILKAHPGTSTTTTQHGPNTN